MKRIQIYLDEELRQTLRAAAAHEGRSAADLVREAIRMYLAGRRQQGLVDPFLEIAGAFRGGPPDASVEHDRHLYGPPTGKPAE